MNLDTTQFPLVWMQDAPEEPHDDDGAFALLEELLQRGEPIVLLTEIGERSLDHEHTQDEKKRTALWMKKHRQELKLVRAMVAIEPSTAKRLAMKSFSIMFEKFWGYPMLMASSREEALKIARRLVRETEPGSFATTDGTA